ncbi:sigma-70 family RNA polymerase sigma factor [Ktedonosporobacter rubrisoli]|uniref:Sigma-70 family RNA polymerase sigma factor n=1 Tax=Ktedonosporobacter rubrisoli TaxID=2509675 RepID=A0A4P6JU31_KTERU|nr:sigma-70 family RNA polymerase sigma factor [Ktedonosporobacter rubrisoli]QBD79107.1 sigma-70 family RNA polymerase sigma factor [Ktedonosporobacter rubrisoli]
MQFSNPSHREDRLHWLAEIYRIHAADLQRFIANKIGDPTMAEDLTSTVFLKALRWLDEDQGAENVRGWLYATARTTIVDYWQAQSQYEMHSLSGLEEQLLKSDGPTFASQQVETRVHHLLSLLPERDRTILTLRYLQGYSAAEIARALGTSAGNIRVLQLRALRRAAQAETTERNRYCMQEKEAPFEAFVKFMTPESRQVLDLAREEMLNLKHWWIGTEHLMWGLASEESLKSFLTPLGITPERIHAGIVFIFDRQGQAGQAGQGTPALADASADTLTLLTPRAKQAIFLAGEEMKDQGEQSIRPTHLLLGLMNEGEGIGAGLMRSLGLSLLQARTALVSPAARQTCAFCGRSSSQVARFFPPEVGIAEGSAAQSGPLICDLCVRRFQAMLGTP